jgi:glutamine amidotransferase
MYLVHSFYAPNCARIDCYTYELEYASALQKNNFTEPNFTQKKSVEWGEKSREFP